MVIRFFVVHRYEDHFSRKRLAAALSFDSTASPATSSPARVHHLAAPACAAEGAAIELLAAKLRSPCPFRSNRT
jgi:hypothetical protein